jgi:hypothetical protein
MKDIITFLKPALTRNDPGPFGCYHFNGGMVHAQNRALQAAAPTTLEETFSVPGEELETALDRMQGDLKIVLKDNTLKINSGRLRATIPVLRNEQPPRYNANLEWRSAPKELPTVLKTALPFVLDTRPGWISCIRLMDNSATTVNNKCGIDIEFPGWQSPPSMLTKDGAEFLVANSPELYASLEGALAFKWSDGRFLQAQLDVQQMPSAVDNIFANAGTEAATSITGEWRAAYADAAAMTESLVEVRRNHLTIKRGATVVEIDVETDVPPDHFSIWETKVLDAMLSCATAWQPIAWTRPTLFVGPECRGVVMGVRA